VKGLRSGDFFGEVSILFGCRRTATIKAKQYCECAFIENKDFLQLLASNTNLKVFLIKNIMKSYDDELRIFLVGCLR
jgi:CRP-like cAMP-binding protein